MHVPTQRPSHLPPEHKERTSRQRSGLTLGHVAGIEVHIDWSLLFIFALIAMNLGAGLFPRWHPEWSPLLRWFTAGSAAVLFLASVLAHELMHALMARRKGVPVRRITLFLFGGVSLMESEPPTPGAEFWIAIVGPLMSLAIGAVSLLAGAQLAAQSLAQGLAETDIVAVEGAYRSAGPVATLLLWLGPVNLFLAVFNLIPGFPLDGGRVLRSLLWWKTGNLTKATRWAAGAGQTLAFFLMGVGVLNLFSGALLQGVWLLILGWFLRHAALSSYTELLLRRSLSNISVSSLMRTQLERVSPGLAVDTFVRDHMLPAEQHAFPVESDGHLLGLVCRTDLRKVDQGRWPEATVEDIMTPTQELTSLSPDAPAEQALEALGREDVDQIPVIKDAHLLGLVRRGDLMRWLMLQQANPSR